MIRLQICAMLIAGLGMAACHSSDAKGERSTDAVHSATNCETNTFPPSGRWSTFPIESSDPTAMIAIKAATGGGELDFLEFKSKYCSYERPAENAVDRCFLFLLNPPTPGGDIKVCVAPDGRVKDIFLEE